MDVDIPWQVPSYNHCFGFRRGGGLFKTPQAKAFQDAVRLSYRGPYIAKGEVEVFIEFHRFPLIDLDKNGAALSLDALQGKAYKNDRQVARLIIDRYKCKKGEDRFLMSVQSIDCTASSHS